MKPGMLFDAGKAQALFGGHKNHPSSFWKITRIAETGEQWAGQVIDNKLRNKFWVLAPGWPVPTLAVFDIVFTDEMAICFETP